MQNTYRDVWFFSEDPLFSLYFRGSDQKQLVPTPEELSVVAKNIEGNANTIPATSQLSNSPEIQFLTSKMGIRTIHGGWDNKKR